MPTASEKLRALDGLYADAERSDPDFKPDVLWDALPLIADVVEAAEQMSDWLELASSNTYGRDLTPIRKFDAVLAALREHLEGGDVT